ncbi:MAG: hypothetical protein HC869_25640 [Rhodospirillales bacterium]|nr:hypothetical protein [Rhodospirillales bacterium]
MTLDGELEKLGLVRKQALVKSEQARRSILQYLVESDSFNADLRAGKVDISEWGLTARVTDHGTVFHIESKPE